MATQGPQQAHGDGVSQQPVAAAQAQFIEPHALATALRSPEERQRTVVIDVRDEDYFQGHVNGSINAPSGKFNDSAALDQIIDSHVAQAGHVVVHCMLSQVRGPRCAALLAERLRERGIDAPSVSVLRGGWAAWLKDYKEDADLVQDVADK